MFENGSGKEALWSWRFVRQENDLEGSLDLSIHIRENSSPLLEVFSDVKTEEGAKALSKLVEAFLGTLVSIEAACLQSIRGVFVSKGDLEVLKFLSVRSELTKAETKLTGPAQ